MDGLRIVFTKTRRDSTEIWVMNADGTDQRFLVAVQEAVRPRWSPDGTKILFTRSSRILLTLSLQHGVFTINPDGTGEEKVWEAPEWATGIQSED